ncbi:MAG: HAD hydrolase-like protein [Bacilli bacterium]|jgi:HAD superfamily phosphatase (TIGR01668 family)|nr:HAD hydrolase-like protein [Bacilli bacterium]MCI2111291.1 HAD hydrolase-like protein [Bacilli bacterium]
MNRKLIPFATASSIYEVDPSFYAKLGIKVLISDLDNTLDAYDVREPGPRAFSYKKRLDEAGIELYIGSNNTSRRVTRYAELLGVPCLSRLLKPFPHRLRRFLKRRGLKPSEVMMVGDQVMTDVKCSVGAGVRIILTEPLTDRDSWVSWFNRHLEKPIREKIEQGHLSPDWREIS